LIPTLSSDTWVHLVEKLNRHAVMNIHLNFCRFAVPLLVFLATLAHSQYTVAADSAQRYGSVVLLSGSVVAVDPAGGKRRRLKVGDVVYVNERMVASAASEAVVRTDDAGVIAVRPGASFAVERFSSRGSDTDHLSLNILTGALRLISGLVGRRNPNGVTVTTPSATVGIRGTDYEPFVLSAEQSRGFQQPVGTYSRVYRGATYLKNSTGTLAVGAGQLGFAPQKSGLEPRGMLTLLMPVLLEKVPAFFVPGRFDAELEQYVDPAALTSAPGSEAKTTLPVASNPETTSAAKYEAENPHNDPTSATTATDPCHAHDVAQDWLAHFDQAIAQRDAQLVLDLFDPQVRITAIVRTSNGQQQTLKFSREEMVRSTISSMSRVSDFKTSRSALNTKALDAACHKIMIESVVVESGLRNGESYRFESIETFGLELRLDHWLAISATTRQR
jgi:hypothetical protein